MNAKRAVNLNFTRFCFSLVLFVFSASLHSVEIKEENLKISSGKIIFLSEAPQETIKGIGKLITGSANLKTKQVEVKIDLTDWRTGNKLRDSHLHENYLETEKYPHAVFQGSIKNYESKTGLGTLVGTLIFHGVTKTNFIIEGKMEKASEGFVWISEFKINLKDFNIPVPKLLFLKLNEVISVEAIFNMTSEK